MRTKLAFALVGLGVLLGVYSFVEPPLVDADPSRPNRMLVGIGVVVIGLLLAAWGSRRRRPDATAHVSAEPAAAADVAVLEPVAPVAPPPPPKADVALRMGGNAASDPSLRWYYVTAATTTEVAARKAELRIAVRGEQPGAQRWQWQVGDGRVDLTQGGAHIPIVIGRVKESAEAPVGTGWVVPFKNWYLTPNATSTLGPFLAPFIAGVRHVFDVTVCWPEGGIAQSSTASFELRFWREPTSEPRFIPIGDRPSYRDQVGGLSELRDRGTALRKEGMMLPLAALGVWLGRVDSWTTETRSLIAEVSTADGEYFSALKNFNAPLFEGIRLHDDRHRQKLRELHERLIRLQFFMKPVAT